MPSLRVLAIVSVDGGPTREALDSVFGLLKGNVQCEDENELMDNDEVGIFALLGTVVPA
jgi:hypothetical protein